MEENIKKVDEQSEVNVEMLVIKQAELTSEIIDLEKTLRAKREEKYKIDNQIAVIKSKFKIGDKIKYNNKEYFVGKIEAGYNNEDQNLFVYKIKKDGTPFANMTRLYCWNKEKLELAL